MSSWGPDLRTSTERARPDVQQRYDAADDTATARASAYFGTAATPDATRDEPRRDVLNPRRAEKARALAYTAEDDL